MANFSNMLLKREIPVKWGSPARGHRRMGPSDGSVVRRPVGKRERHAIAGIRGHGLDIWWDLSARLGYVVAVEVRVAGAVERDIGRIVLVGEVRIDPSHAISETVTVVAEAITGAKATALKPASPGARIPAKTEARARNDRGRGIGEAASPGRPAQGQNSGEANPRRGNGSSNSRGRREIPPMRG